MSSEGEDEDVEQSDKLYDTTLREYQRQTSTDSSTEVDRTRRSIAEVIRSQACLVCLDPISHSDAVWSCHGCYTIYHLTCIQRWVKEGVHQAQLAQLLSGETDVEKKNSPWCCPKCRKEYQHSFCPTKYFCYCGKVRDPPKDPWLVPHSCGQVCGAKLGCTHTCLLLCHPGIDWVLVCVVSQFLMRFFLGPHPNCPVTIRTKCGCGKSPAEARRCGNQEWTCRRPCGKKLSCGFHICPLTCHSKECQPCGEQSQRYCACHKKRENR